MTLAPKIGTLLRGAGFSVWVWGLGFGLYSHIMIVIGPILYTGVGGN